MPVDQSTDCTVSVTFARIVWRGAGFALAALIAAMALEAQPATAGVWTQLTTQSPSGDAGTMMLLTDGTVMVIGANDAAVKTWYRLSPDASGNYINGTWSSLASMSLERLFFASNVLPSGKVFVLGGEYSGPQTIQNIVNSGEIYDPVADKWTSIPNFPQPEFGDDPTMLLPSGKILCGYIFDGRTYLFDPSNNTWSPTGTKLRNDASDEETWVLLPDGSVLSYDIFSSQSGQPGHAQRYVPSTGTWVDAGSVPVYMTGSNVGYELGPAGLLADGRVIQIGANEKTALYKPSTNTWAVGPSLPTGMGSDDAPGVVLPNGHFLFVADFYLFNSPSKIFDFNPSTNQITDVTPGGTLGSELATLPAFLDRFLMLPNGHVLFNAFGDLWDYMPDGGPQSAWRPKINGITKQNSTTFTLTGTQLTGISQGASYGDDAEMDTNYPLVRLTDATNKVRYARTSSWTPGVATGSLITSVQFTIPTGFPPGTYNLSAVANGIASNPIQFSIGAPGTTRLDYNTATKTLTMTGDNNENALTITKSGTNVTAQCGGGNMVQLSINGGPLGPPAVSATIPNVAGAINVTGNLSNGNDSVSFVSLPITTINLQLGSGNDAVYMTYCNVTTCAIDGGPGTDTFITTTTSISVNANVNIP